MSASTDQPADSPPMAAPSCSRADGPGLLAGACFGCAAAATRAVLFALRDGYFKQPDLQDLMARSIRGDLLQGALVAVPVAALAVGLARRARTPRRVACGLALATLTALFLSGRVPASPFHAPGFGSNRALLAHAAALVVAAFGATIILRPGARWPGRLAALGAVGALALVGAASYLTGASGTAPDRPGVVLISLDTTRPDRLGAYGSESGLTPTLDALAAESVRFTRAYSPQPFTLTAHMTMLTGLSPSVHALAPEYSLPDGVTTLAESFRDEGYVTAAFVDTVAWLQPRYGFDRGFAIYRQIEGDASTKDEQVRLLLEDVGDRPLFLFVHVYDAHSDESVLPYEADAPHFQRVAGWYEGDFDGCLPERGCASKLLLEMNRLGESLDGDDRRYLSSLYDAGLASLDDRLARLFQRLQRSGTLDRSVLLITADHGEEFFEHGRALHDQNYEESVRVPLLVRMPGGATVGERSDLVGLSDIAPTVRDLTGLPTVPGQGVSFADALEGARNDTPGDTVRDAVLLDSGRGSLGLVTARWKYFPTRDGFELYDLATDPDEQHDLLAAGSPPDTLPALRARLQAMLEDVRAHRLALGLPADPAVRPDTGIESPLSEDALRQLEALGYTR